MKTLEFAKKAGRRFAITIGSRPGAEYVGLSDREIMEDVQKKVQAVSSFVEKHNPDVIFSIAGMLMEAETLGAKITLKEYGSPVVDYRPLEGSNDPKKLCIEENPYAFTLCRNLVDSIRVLRARYREKHITASLAGPITVVGQLMGVENMLMQSVESPGFLKEVLHYATERIIEILNLQINAGATFVHMADPMSSLLSPKAFAELSFPFIERVFGAIQLPNFLHICGNTNNHLPVLSETSAHAVSVDAGVDMKKAAKLFNPDTAVCGQLDSAGVLARGTHTEVTERTREMLEEMAPFPNYIPASSCGMTRTTPAANIQAFFDTVRSYHFQ